MLLLILLIQIGAAAAAAAYLAYESFRLHAPEFLPSSKTTTSFNT